ncbi:MAG: YicC family protein [Clostridiales bacterium]|nr:YicC family protein [Clostridiales bacterium]
MVKSMTGYGRAQDMIDGYNISFEIKSVNHRYFEYTLKSPRAYGFLDDRLKKYLQQFISRGKVDCFLTIEALDEENVTVNVNHSLASGYINAFNELSERYSIPNDITVSSFARYGDIFVVSKAEADEERVWNAVKTVVSAAVSNFIAMRETEGAKMRDDILSRADSIIECVEFIEERSPQTVKEYNDKLLERMRELIGDTTVDEQRLLTEAAIFADKIAVAEETVRLRSHIAQLRTFFDSDEAVGRKLDFLVQEINREANTIGSKAQNVEIARRVLNIKAEVEKIREQIQNIE